MYASTPVQKQDEHGSFVQKMKMTGYVANVILISPKKRAVEMAPVQIWEVARRNIEDGGERGDSCFKSLNIFRFFCYSFLKYKVVTLMESLYHILIVLPNTT